MKRLAMARQAGLSQAQLLQLTQQGRMPPTRPPPSGNIDLARLQQLKQSLPPGSLPNGLSPAIQQQLLQMSQNHQAQNQASQSNDSAQQLQNQGGQNQNQNQQGSVGPQQATPNLSHAPLQSAQPQPPTTSAPTTQMNNNVGVAQPPWANNPMRNPSNMLPEEDWLRVFRTVNQNPNLNYPHVDGKELSLYRLFTVVFAYNGYRFVSASFLDCH